MARVFVVDVAEGMGHKEGIENGNPAELRTRKVPSMRDFNASTRKALARKGITVIGMQAAPAYDGDTSFSGRVYRLDDNGCCRMRSHAEVLELAQ